MPLYRARTSTIVGITGTMSQFDTAVTDGNFVYQSTAPTLTGTNITGTAAGLTAGVASAVAVGGITGLGTGVATALAVNVGTAGAPVVNGGALGTPSSGVATNLTGTASGLTAGNVTTNANLTGPITSVGNATAITNNAVTLAMMAQMATASLLGRNTAATGNVEVLSAATAKTLLSLNNVENTALSTWAGTTNITTIGAATATSLVTATLNGGTAANADITIQGTTNATRTTSYVSLQPTAGAVVVGSTTAPSVRLGETFEVVVSANYGGAVLSAWSASSDHAGLLDFNKSASNTIGTQAAVVNNERLGSIGALGSDGTAFQSSAAIVFRVNGTVTSGHVPGLIDFFTSSTTVGDVARERLDGVGNHGFGGNTSPTAKIHPGAGTATASTAPGKKNSGTLLTAVEAGAEEFLTDDRYFTITTGPARKTYAWTPAQTDVTASRALDTTYTAPATRSIMVMATARCAVTLAGGTADIQAKSDSSTPPTTVASGLIGIQAGLLGEDNSFQLSFVVAAGMKYRIDSAATNGTVTLGKWFEVAF